MKRLVPSLLAMACAAAAQAAEPVSEDLFFGEMPMVLTASRIAQSPLDAPAPVTVIDRETIRASGFTEIHDLLRLVPGFLVADWHEGSPHVVNIGMGDASNGRLQVLLDGRSVYNPFTGRVDWQELPLRVDDIERIEVVRGPNPASYGANAFLGVVNIISRAPAAERGGEASLTVGNQQIREYAARYGGGKDGLDWRVSLSRREAINFRDTAVDGDGFDGGEEIRRDVFNGQLDYRLSATDQLHFQFGGAWGDDRVSDLEEAVLPAPRKNETMLFQAGWRRSYAPDSEISLQYYHFERKDRYEFRPYVDPIDEYLSINRDVNVRRDDLEFQQIHAFSPTLRGIWGAGVRQDRVESEHYLSGLGTEGGTQWQLFGNIDWRFDPKWRLNAGAMVERHYYTDTLVSPRLALTRYLDNNQVIRASTGRAYRAPTIFNAHARQVYRDPDAPPLLDPGPDGELEVGYWSYYELEPEQVDFFEIGYLGRFPQLGLQVDARVFVNKYDDYIDDKSCILNLPNGDTCTWQDGSTSTMPDVLPDLSPFADPEIFVFYNMGGARVRGAEVQLDWRSPVLGRFVLGHSYVRIKADVETLAEVAEPDFEESVPLQTTSLLWSRGFASGITTSLGAYFVDDMRWLNDGDIQPAHWRYDMKVAKRLGKQGSSDEVALTVQSLGGRYDQFAMDKYSFERRAFVTLRLGW